MSGGPVFGIKIVPKIEFTLCGIMNKWNWKYKNTIIATKIEVLILMLQTEHTTKYKEWDNKLSIFR